MNQHRFKAISAFGALAATVVLCLGVSCSQTIPDPPPQPASAPHITAGTPADVAVTGGSAAVFTVTVVAGAYPAPSFQWEVSTDAGATWTAIADATSASLTISGTSQTADNGKQFRCTATNTAGSDTSRAALLSVADPYVMQYVDGAMTFGINDPGVSTALTQEYLFVKPNNGKNVTAVSVDLRVADTTPWTACQPGSVDGPWDATWTPLTRDASFHTYSHTLGTPIVADGTTGFGFQLSTGGDNGQAALHQDIYVDNFIITYDDDSTDTYDFSAGDGIVPAAFQTKSDNAAGATLALGCPITLTPPHAGQELLWSTGAGDFNIADTQYGFQQNNSAIGGLLTAAAGDIATIQVKGVTEWALVAGEKIEVVIADTAEAASWWDELTDRGTILEGPAAAGTAIDVTLDLTFAKPVIAGHGLNCQTAAGNDGDNAAATSPDKHVTLDYYRIWK